MLSITIKGQMLSIPLCGQMLSTSSNSQNPTTIIHMANSLRTFLLEAAFKRLPIISAMHKTK